MSLCVWQSQLVYINSIQCVWNNNSKKNSENLKLINARVRWQVCGCNVNTFGLHLESHVVFNQYFNGSGCHLALSISLFNSLRQFHLGFIMKLMTQTGNHCINNFLYRYPTQKIYLCKTFISKTKFFCFHFILWLFSYFSIFWNGIYK